MEKAIWFSASIRTVEGKIGQCFVTYLYPSTPNIQYGHGICHIDSVIHLLNNNSQTNKELWDYKLCSGSPSIEVGKKLVTSRLETLFPDIETFLFNEREKHLIEKNQKQAYVIIDNVSNEKIIELIDSQNRLIIKEFKEDFALTFQKIEDKYL